MKKLNIALLISGMMLAGVAQANFEGFSVGAGLGMTHGKYQWEGTDYKENVKYDDKFTKTKFSSQLDLNYTFSIYNNVVLGLGGTYGINDVKFDDDGGYIKMQRHFSLYAAPGYLITPDIMVYTKFAYHRAKFKFPLSSENRNGFGFGAGLSYAIMPNLELGGEIQHILFGKKHRALEEWDKSEDKLRATEFTVVVKYRF